MNRINIVTIKMEKVKSMLVENKQISSPNDVFTIVNKYLDRTDREHLVLLTLDIKNKITSINTVSIGSINTSIVHPREVFKTAILSNASSVILTHNHPSGDVTPSKEDIDITNRIKECGRILGIELLDHVIIGNDKYSSLKEKGII
ncbi:JAB domain-containing protein [Paraclostridium bifermentans]|uniref:JAB domain-containing protein n=1 Tax=Paraclostridium bifermentans TaxID=1490 RepID=UPI0011DCF273|nr:DNA repair protein RadC [Paraclostridium bifermentans]